MTCDAEHPVGCGCKLSAQRQSGRLGRGVAAGNTLELPESLRASLGLSLPAALQEGIASCLGGSWRAWGGTGLGGLFLVV